MLANVIMISGSGIFIFSLIMFVATLISPLVVRWKNVHGDVELIETDKINHSRRKDRTFFYILFISLMIIGSILFCLGFSLGYADKGKGFWFYRLVEGNISETQKWDRISEDGDFIASDGKKYPYYILIRGNTYEFKGIECEDIEDVNEYLSHISRENTIMLIDSFAVAKKINDVEILLKEMGIQYEIEEV